MIESAAQVDDGIAALDRASEEQWQRLRRQVEWASAFWLGFVFCQSPQIAATFRARIEHLLRYRARSVHVLVPPSPNELGSLLQVLFEPAMTAKGLVWVEAIRADPLRSCADQPGPWTAAWDQLLLLLNERRDALSRHLQGGLMMVAPVAVKPRARVAAPDVWSIRSVVIEVPARVERSAADSGDEIEATDGLRSPAGEPVSPARMQFREIDAFLARGETAQATALARKAVATQRARSARLCAEALEWLCRSRTAEGDIAAALEHVGEAIHLRRSLVRSAGELSPPLRELASSLALAGKLRQDTGDLEGSEAAFQESLTICRRLLQVDGATPQTLRDTEARLCNVAEVQHARGDLTGAAAAYGEAVELCRRLMELVGEAPQAQQDLVGALDGLGRVTRRIGDLARSRAAHEEALTLYRRLIAKTGPSPSRDRQLAALLNNAVLAPAIW